MSSGSIFSKDSFCSRIINIQDFRGPINTKVLLSNKFDKLHSSLNDGNFYLYGYFLIVCLGESAVCIIGRVFSRRHCLFYRFKLILYSKKNSKDNLMNVSIIFE